MNLKEIKSIINLMNENQVEEIEVEQDGMKIKIRKTATAGGAGYRSPFEYKIETQPAVVAGELAAGANAAAKSTKDIVSPMVGTFYRSPSPESPPFVEVGQVVEIGQVVCIVEAMKLMNEIKSEIRGRVVEVAIENAEPVEFGQTLFVLDPV